MALLESGWCIKCHKSDTLYFYGNRCICKECELKEEKEEELKRKKEIRDHLAKLKEGTDLESRVQRLERIIFEKFNI